MIIGGPKLDYSGLNKQTSMHCHVNCVVCCVVQMGSWVAPLPCSFLGTKIDSIFAGLILKLVNLHCLHAYYLLC